MSPATPESRTKLVVRCIPPCLAEEEFRESVSRWANQISWLSYSHGRYDAARKRVTRPGFAHLQFGSSAAALEFSEVVDGARYRDCEHNESRLMVEWALSQRVPASVTKRHKPRLDRRIGTIDKDASFLAFLATLEQEESGTPAPSISPEIQSSDVKSGGASADSAGIVVTPLMAYLKDLEKRRLQRAAAAAARKAEAVQKKKLEERKRLQAELLARKEKLRREQEERSRRAKAAKEERRVTAAGGDARKTMGGNMARPIRESPGALLRQVLPKATRILTKSADQRIAASASEAAAKNVPARSKGGAESGGKSLPASARSNSGGQRSGNNNSKTPADGGGSGRGGGTSGRGANQSSRGSGRGRGADASGNSTSASEGAGGSGVQGGIASASVRTAGEASSRKVEHSNTHGRDGGRERADGDSGGSRRAGIGHTNSRPVLTDAPDKPPVASSAPTSKQPGGKRPERAIYRPGKGGGRSGRGGASSGPKKPGGESSA